MPPGREFKETVMREVRTNPEYARGMLGEALTLLIEGDTTTAKILLRDLVNASLGFRALAAETGLANKSLQHMLGPNGNPTIESLAAITQVLLRTLSTKIRVQAIAV